jgi:predicted nicotinamide N-methyase
MSSDDEDWRADVEYSTAAVRVGGRFEFAVTQQDELPPFAALAMLAELGESASEISGKRVWAGSQVLCAHLVAHGAALIPPGACTLELGAGSGIASMTAAALGASLAVATDGDPEVVAMLAGNMAQNNEAARPGRLAADSLWWGDDGSLRALLAAYGGGGGGGGGSGVCDFRVLLAGDVLYKHELLPLFFGTVSRLLALPDAAATAGTGTADGDAERCAAAAPAPRRLLLCHIPRAAVEHAQVVATAEEHGLVVVRRELTPEDLAALEKEGGGEVEMADASRARVYDIALPAAGAEGSAAVRARWAMGAAAPVAS